jgi:amino-acid N-acetyltransferase
VIGLLQRVIRHGGSPDLPAVAALLRQARLPIDDLSSAPGLRVWVLEIDGELAGAAALEGTESTARLLRSVVVAPGHQRGGLGRDLVSQVEREARDQGIEQLVLLTETAQTLFERLGYEVIDRAAAPEVLQQSAEFRSLCPASTVCMSKRLSPTRV